MKADFEKGTKVCSKCKRELPIGEFYKNKRNIDGLKYYCKECVREENAEYNGKERNTFRRKGRERGKSGVLKRDYELSLEQLNKRNRNRKLANVHYKKTENMHGLLIWYDGKLNDLSSEQYLKEQKREYMLQRNCAIRGYVRRKEPSIHFLFDFDLEQMLKDNVYCSYGDRRKYIEKWWPGTIRHWTVKDGIWRK